MFRVGDEFNSFDDLLDKISKFEQAQFVQLYIRRSRTIIAAAKRKTKKIYNKDLKYAELEYACINGGKNFKTTSTGERPNQRTFQMQCPFSIKLSCSTDGQLLVIKSMINEHNHEISQNTFKHLPRQRRLNEHALQDTQNMLSVKGNKKMIQQHLYKQEGKIVTLKDLQNISDKGKSSMTVDVNSLVEEMKKVDGAVVEVSTNSNNVLSSVFFQKQSWQNMYARYPELILIDATYKLINLRMPMYILMVVDGNGESEIIALWLVVYEDKDTISHLMNIFVKHNDTANTKCIMAVCRYASTEVRNHLVTCFENGHMTSFPSSAVKKKKALMKQVNVYCQCRLPYVLEHMKNPGNEVAVMVQCYICDNLYHFSCVNLSLDQAKRIKRTKEMWMCDYKGCNNAFGDLFDSDSD